MTVTKNQSTSSVSKERDHISVCICTYKRPLYLSNLLKSVINQKPGSDFSYSIVVVDNDYLKSAETTVRESMKDSHISLEYFTEPKQNISLARNKAIEMAKGKYIALIDDDEFPVDDWLCHLYKTQSIYNKDGVLGPVVPFYTDDTPKWLKKSKICERKTHTTGTIVHRKNVRTGNVLLNRDVLIESDIRFDPIFGMSGGEDTAFFEELLDCGKSFVWCNEAVVYENIPPERWNKSYYIKKLIRSGGLDGEKDKQSSRKYRALIRSIGGLVIYLLLFPFYLFQGIRGVMKVFLKISYYYGWLVGFFFKPIFVFREEFNVKKY